MAHHIIHAHSSLAKLAPVPVGGLPPRRLKSILDFIEDNVAQPIALRQLAGLAGVSARLFERAFRQAMGSPPHAYVMERRLATARDRLLSCPKLAVGEIARRTWVQQLQPSCCGISSSDRVLPHDISATPVALTGKSVHFQARPPQDRKKNAKPNMAGTKTRSLRRSA